MKVTKVCETGEDVRYSVLRHQYYCTTKLLQEVSRRWRKIEMMGIYRQQEMVANEVFKKARESEEDWKER